MSECRVVNLKFKGYSDVEFCVEHTRHLAECLKAKLTAAEAELAEAEKEYGQDKLDACYAIAWRDERDLAQSQNKSLLAQVAEAEGMRCVCVNHAEGQEMVKDLKAKWCEELMKRFEDKDMTHTAREIRSMAEGMREGKQ